MPRRGTVWRQPSTSTRPCMNTCWPAGQGSDLVAGAPRRFEGRQINCRGVAHGDTSQPEGLGSCPLSAWHRTRTAIPDRPVGFVSRGGGHRCRLRAPRFSSTSTHPANACSGSGAPSNRKAWPSSMCLTSVACRVGWATSTCAYARATVPWTSLRPSHAFHVVGFCPRSLRHLLKQHGFSVRELELHRW